MSLVPPIPPRVKRSTRIVLVRDGRRRHDPATPRIVGEPGVDREETHSCANAEKVDVPARLDRPGPWWERAENRVRWRIARLDDGLTLASPGEILVHRAEEYSVASTTVSPPPGTRKRVADCHNLPARTRMVRSSTDKSIADVQQYWDARPCNIRHSPKPVGSREYFDEVEARKYLVEPHIPAFAEFERWAGKRVLEVGCGIGTDSINFARAGAELTAVDLSSESLRIAEQRAEVMGVADRIRFVQANAEELTSALDERAVRPRLLVRRRPPHAASRAGARGDPRADGAGRDAEADGLPPPLVEGLLDRRRAGARPLLEDGRARREALRGADRLPGHVQLHARSRAASSSSGAASASRTCHVDHVFPYRIRDYVEYRYVKEPYFRWMPEPLFRAFERRFGWHLLDHGGSRRSADAGRRRRTRKARRAARGRAREQGQRGSRHRREPGGRPSC